MLMLTLTSFALTFLIAYGQLVTPETCRLATALADNFKFMMAKLSTSQKRTFIKEGFLILPEPLPDHLIRRAEAFAEHAYANNRYNLSQDKKLGSTKPTVNFYKPVRQAPEITDLFYKTYLAELANELLDGHAFLRESLGQIAYTPTSDLAKAQGMPMDEKHKKWRWHIDAGHAEYRAICTDFSFLIGVALSEGQEIDENRGQFTIFPVVLTGVEDVVETFKKNKPDVGEPVRALLKKGHVMIAHQRLAHAPGINLSDVVRKNIYFRVAHDEHEDLMRKSMVAPTPWTGFYGLRDLLPEGATEGL